MKTAPIYVPREHYRGGDLRKKVKRDNFNRVASKVEAYLNDEIVKMPIDSVRVFPSYAVASAIREDAELVRQIVFRVDGGSNGITCWKGDYNKALKNPI